MARPHLARLRDKLAESLDALGLLHPIVIDTQNRLIAGHRRLEVAKLLKWKTVLVTVENACRKDFTPRRGTSYSDRIRPFCDPDNRRLPDAGAVPSCFTVFFYASDATGLLQFVAFPFQQ